MTTMDAILDRIRTAAENPESIAKWEAVQEERRRQSRADLSRAKERALEALDLPARAAAVIPKDTQALRAMSGDWTLLILSGQTGCGKTVAASSWLRSWVSDDRNWTGGDGFVPRLRGRAPLFLTSAHLARWARYDDTAMTCLLRASRLVLDDLGGEYVDEKGAFLSLLDELVNERYANRLPMLITTNLGPVDFRARYGERFADRIREAGRFAALTDPSMRKKTQP